MLGADRFQLWHGDCLDMLAEMEDNSVDSVVTDPPYGIRFMGAAWDGADIVKKTAERRASTSTLYDNRCGATGGHASVAAEAGKYDTSLRTNRMFQEWCIVWATACFRVMKPGAHLIAFGSPRVHHRLHAGIEDAGFEIRDCLMWVFGQGFPKSHNLGGGWGTALKPAYEPIILARKPCSESTVAANVLRWGTGGINIDGCRVPNADAGKQDRSDESGATARNGGATSLSPTGGPRGGSIAGRFPANLLHDGSDEVLAAFPDAPGQQGDLIGHAKVRKSPNGCYGTMAAAADALKRTDASTSAARFFYQAKANKDDRAGSKHPTVKPVDLMRYLCRLITPPGGLILDPFAGSGTTGEAAILECFRCILSEREDEYVADIERRMATLS